ncbi:MAG: metallophosphoesterase [Tahibacter sp.]
MRTLLHLSDLHFGRVDEALLQPLQSFARKLGPDLVVVSGDLTQRARSEQFRQARQFLDGLPTPQIVVPGNHDVPLFDIVSRFFRPRTKFRRYISRTERPSYVDEEIAVVGVDTTRSLTIKDGRINAQQIAQVRAVLDPLPKGLVKIIVSHHPFDLLDPRDENDLVGRAPLAMREFASSGVDILLSGHLHVSRSGEASMRRQGHNEAALLIQAGTATSTRSRGESNTFNVIRIATRRIDVQRVVWQTESQAFVEAESERFDRCDAGWRRAERSSGASPSRIVDN